MKKISGLKFFPIYFLALLLPNAMSGQTEERIEILIGEAYGHLRNLELENVINRGFEIAELSKAVGYERGIVEGYILIADILSKSGDYEKCIVYFEKIKAYEESYLKISPVSRFSYYMLQSEVYHFMNIPSQAAEYYKKAEAAILQEPDKNKRDEGLYHMYTVTHFYNDNPDTAYVYLLKAKAIATQPSFKEKRGFEKTLDKALIELSIGNYYLEKSQPDSAIQYYNRAMEISVSIGGHYIDGGIYNGYGSAYRNKKHFDKSIESYQKALEIFKKYNSSEDIKNVYANIADLYGLMGNHEKRNELVALEAALKDTLENKKAKGRNISILNLVNEKEAAVQNGQIQQRNSVIFISTISIALLGSGLWGFIIYKKRKEKILSEKNRLIQTKELKIGEKKQRLNQLHIEIQEFDTELRRKEKENDWLRQKVNESFEEILHAARENDPHFWIRFQEAYPEFQEKLLCINSNLKVSEMKLCAYLYLGFTTKEIAEYTFKAIKTIENNRYHLRKRLGLSPDLDITLWLQNHIKS